MRGRSMYWGCAAPRFHAQSLAGRKILGHPSQMSMIDQIRSHHKPRRNKTEVVCDLYRK